MGNLSTTFSKQTDICLQVVAKHLVDKFHHKVKYFEPTEQNYDLMLQQKYELQTIWKFGDVYLFCLHQDELEHMKETNCIIAPFIRQLCGDIYSDLTDDDLMQSDNTNIVFIVGFSQINWCKVIAAAKLTIRVNPYAYDKINSNLHPLPELVLTFLCSARANTEQASIQLAKSLYGMNESEYSEACTKETTPNKNKCDIIHKHALQRVKLGLGQLLIIFIFKYLTVNFKKFEYMTLRCDPELFSYYESLGFQMGPSPMYRYKEPFVYYKHNKKQPRTVNPSEKHILDWSEFYQQSMHYKKESLRNFHKADPKLMKSTDLNIFVNPVDIALNQINMHISYDRQTIQDIIDKIQKYKPNVFHIVNSKELLSKAFNISDDTKRLESLIAQTRCLNVYLDHVGNEK
jgi:hypothetical protein